MSTLDSKLEQERPREGGRARASLESLRRRWRGPGAEINGKKPPVLIVVETADRSETETWRMWGGADGEKTMYELIERKTREGNDESQREG